MKERTVIFMAQCSCNCGGDQNLRLLYACSGAADVGQVADLVARRLLDRPVRAIDSDTGIGANLSGFIESAREADNIIIDGCPVGCGRKMFEARGLPFTEIVITQQGLVKGSAPATPEVVERMAETVKTVVAGR